MALKQSNLTGTPGQTVVEATTSLVSEGRCSATYNAALQTIRKPKMPPLFEKLVTARFHPLSPR